MKQFLIVGLVCLLVLPCVVQADTQLTQSIEFRPGDVPEMFEGELVLPGANQRLQLSGGPDLPMTVHTFRYPLGTEIHGVTENELRISTTRLASPLADIPPRRVVGSGSAPVSTMISNALLQSGYYPDRWYDLERYQGLDPETLKPTVFAVVRVFPVRVNGTACEYLTELDIALDVTVPDRTETRETAGLLIICPALFQDELAPYITHRESNGVTTLLQTVEEIGINYPAGRDLQEKVKLAMADTFAQSCIRFVLFVGDAGFIPVRYTFHTNFGGNNGWTNTPSDLYYSDLFGHTGTFCDWDANGNGLYGEYLDGNGDGCDFMPDVLLGRIPVNTETEVTGVINKIIRYENLTGSEEWLSHAVLLGADTFNSEEQSDWSGVPEGEATSELIASESLTDYNITRLYQTNTYPRDDALTPDTILAATEAGTKFLNYANHGNVTIWGWGGRQFSVDHVRSMTNFDRLPIVYSYACLTGAFDTENPESPAQGTPECLAEAFINYADGGAIGFYGSSRNAFGGGYGYGGHSSCMGYLDRSFFQGVAAGHEVLGQLYAYSLADLLINKGVYDVYEFITALEYHYFGDPVVAAGGHCVAPDFAVGYLGINDTAGGNGDGCAAPGETMGFKLDFCNNGFPATGVSAQLTISDPDITVSQNTVVLPDFPLGYREITDPAFDITIASGTTDGRVIPFQITVIHDGGQKIFEYLLSVGTGSYLYSTNLYVTSDPGNDHIANPGDKLNFSPVLQNIGCSAAISYTATVDIQDNWVTDYGYHADEIIDDIAPGTSMISEKLFWAEIDPLAPHNHEVTCHITLQSPTGPTVTYDLILPILDYTMPIISDFTISPAEPDPGDTVSVTVRALDGNGVDIIEANFLSYGEYSLANIPMFDDGMHGDGAAGDNIFGCQIDLPDMSMYYRVDIFARDLVGYSGTVPGIGGVSTIAFVTDDPVLVICGAQNDLYLGLFTQALEDTGYGYDVWSYARGVPPYSVLESYTDGAVIWYYGHEYPMLGDSEREVIQTYLEAGGSLFITEQDIGWAMVEKGTPEMTAWYHDVLLADYISDGVDQRLIDGVGGDPVGDALAFSIEEGSGARNQDWPSLIEPIAPAVSCLTYRDYPGPESGCAGIRAIHESGGRHVYLPFGFEGISSQADRAVVMDNIMTWFGVARTGKTCPWNQSPGWWIGPESLSEMAHAPAVFCEGDGKIYVASGIGFDNSLDPSIYTIDTVTGESADTGTDLSQGLLYPSVACLQDHDGYKIYFAGGTDLTTGLRSVEVYDPATNTVSELTSDPVPESLAGVSAFYATANNKLYVIGSWQFLEYWTGETWVFDPLAPAGNRWSNLNAELTVPRYSGAAAVIDNKIYTIGGYWAEQDGEDVLEYVHMTVEVLNLSDPNPQWVYGEAADLPEPLIFNGAAAIPAGANVPHAGKIITSHGIRLSTGPEVTYLYDVAANTWESFIPMQITRYNRNPLVYVPSARGPEIWSVGGHFQWVHQNTEIYYLGTEPMAPWIGIRTDLNGIDAGATLHISLDLAGDSDATPVDCYIALEVAGLWFFLSTDPVFPTFTPDPAPFFTNVPLPYDLTYSGPLLQIPMPDSIGSFKGTFYAATLESGTGNLAGGLAWSDFMIP